MIDRLVDLDGAASTHPQAGDLLPAANPPIERGGGVLPVTEPYLGEEELREVMEVLRSGFVSSAGPAVARFEEALARQCATRFASATSSGTAALDLLMTCLDVGPGDEVVVPALAFISVGAVVARAGARPVFAEVDRDSLNVTAETVAPCIGPRTRGVIAVHTYGHPCRMEELRGLADRHGLFLLEDTCEALGATDPGGPAGGLGDAGVHSFYANKMLTTGNGGAVTTSHEGLHERLRALRGYSYAPERFFWHHHLPVNARMSALQAALGTAQLAHLPEILARRQAVADAYAQGLSPVEGLTLPSPPPAGSHAWWMYTVHVEPGASGLTAPDLRAALALDGIETRPVFSPLHVQPVLQERAAPAQGPFPVAEWAASTGLNLPTSAAMGEAQVERVCAVVRQAFGQPA